MKFLDIHEDCPTALVQALQRFNKKITSSHSTTALSHKHSIWSLCKKELEPAITEILGPDMLNVIAKDGFSENARKDARKLEDRIRKISKVYSMRDWKDQKTRRICGALETLISLIHFCKSFMPHTYTARNGNEGKKELLRRLTYRKNLEHFPFCELCEELCEAEYMKIRGDKPEYKEKSSPSSRFCRTHKPGSAAYRRDHNRREAFHIKVKELGNALGYKTYTEGIEELRALLEEQFYFDEDFMVEVWAGQVDTEIIIEKDEELRGQIKSHPESYSEFDAIIRFVAYRIVLPKKEKTRRKTSLSGKGATLKKLREALANGKNISEAAKEAGVSRQAGWKALKKAGDI